VRDHGRVVSKAVVLAYAVHESGVREVIGLDIGEVESGPTAPKGPPVPGASPGHRSST
jgi:transposase-like protein